LLVAGEGKNSCVTRTRLPASALPASAIDVSDWPLGAPKLIAVRLRPAALPRPASPVKVGAAASATPHPSYCPPCAAASAFVGTKRSPTFVIPCPDERLMPGGVMRLPSGRTPSCTVPLVTMP
jgi:hypothetical protein